MTYSTSLMKFIFGSLILILVPGVYSCVYGKTESPRSWMMGCGVSCGVAVAILVSTASAAVVCAMNETGDAHFIATLQGGNPIFLLDDMSVLPPTNLYTELREEIKDNEHWTVEKTGYTYALADVHEAPLLIYNGTKIAGNWETLPQVFKGVFWMEANGLPEVLATMQYAEWFESEQALVRPSVPFGWGWYGGEEPPPGASEFMNAYGFINSRDLAASLGEGNGTLVQGFKPCPRGSRCEHGADDFAYADLFSHTGGDTTNPGALTKYARWTMEEDTSVSPPGSFFYRRVSGVCNMIEFGSYNLVKILDENAVRIEPHYSRYVEFMNGAPLILWTGFGEGRRFP